MGVDFLVQENNMSEELTLTQIFQLLKDHFEDYANISDTQTDKFIQQIKKFKV